MLCLLRQRLRRQSWFKYGNRRTEDKVRGSSTTLGMTKRESGAGRATRYEYKYSA
jgi:hypothetical protein